MKKRLLAILCMLAIVVSVFTVVSAATETTDTANLYQVGYAKRSVNPDEDSDGTIDYTLPLTGLGDYDGATFVDDNGDGKVDTNDGVFVTCTSVTDTEGTTVLYITMDTMGPYAQLVKDIKDAILANETLAGNVTADHILISGSHTHSAPGLWEIYTNKSSYSDYESYIAFMTNQIVDAAVEAFSGKTPAVMSKGAIDASDSYGSQLNYVRHYNVTLGVWNIRKYVSGDNFGGVTTGSGLEINEVAAVNDTMQLLQFKPTDGTAPIVFVNWNAHPSLTGIADRTAVSGDYINALRYKLEQAGYQAAFFIGASGNINPKHINGADYTPWMKDTKYSFSTNEYSNRYGWLLADVALDCLNDDSAMKECAPGLIFTKQVTHEADIQKDFEDTELLAAAQAYVENGTKNANYINSLEHANGVITRSDFTSDTRSIVLNAIGLGEEVAFVTAPAELFDRYDANYASVYDRDNPTAYTNNDWNELVDDTYGTPFVLGYTDGYDKYIPNAMAYDYNAGNSSYGTGSYEANVSYYAQGTGEAIIDTYATMLADVMNPRMADCEHCGEEKIWTPLYPKDLTTATTLTDGHYYLVGNVARPASSQNTFNISGTVCLDMNGKGFNAHGRALSCSGATLNLMDTVGGGYIAGSDATNNPNGGVAYIQKSSTLNMYSGTLKYVDVADVNSCVVTGGVISISGSTVHLKGGTIDASKCTLIDDTLDGVENASTDGGAAVTVAWGSSLTVSGDTQIIGGAACDGGVGDCVYVHGKSTNDKVILGGSAKVDEIYYNILTQNSLTIDGTYNGTVALNYATTPALGDDIGNTTNSANIVNANISIVGADTYGVLISGTDLIVTGYSESDCAIIGATGYETLQKAIEAYDGTGYIKLRKTTSENVTVDGKNVYLDLNGRSITGTVTVSDGYTLYGMDNKTSDYEVNADHTGYGRISGTITGNVEGVPVDSDVATDGYLKITESNGTSFHAVNLQLAATNLRPKSIDSTSFDPGMYYSTTEEGFYADQVIVDLINNSEENYYGIAMLADDGDSSNGKEIPSAATLKDDNHSKYDTYAVDNEQKVNGTLLSGILKESNNVLINRRNANITVYGSAYIKIGDQYMFGPCVEQSLRNLFVGKTVVIGGVEKTQTPINDRGFLAGLSNAQWESVLGLYKKYQTMIDAWITESGETNYFHEVLDNTISILGIGNSYTIDSMWMLGEVYQAENPGKDVKLGLAYKSGESLAGHVKNIDAIASDPGNAAVYNYLYWDSSTDKWTVADSKMTLQDIIKAQQWEMVSMQQSSARSGDPSTYNGDIQTIQSYVENQLGYVPTYLWNMTWAYPVNDIEGDTGTTVNTSATFESLYGSSQATMYKKIVETVQAKIVPDTTFEYLMPVGTAIQNANATLDDPDLYRDNTHLSDFARLIAAYTWYCELEHTTLNTFQLEALPTVNCNSTSWHNGSARDLTDVELPLAIESVKAAMQDNFTTTDTSVYEDN